MNYQRQYSLEALSVLLVPMAFLITKPLFRDELIYIWYSEALKANPLNPFPYVGYRIPHPPGMWYFLIPFLSYPRIGAFLITLLSGALLYRYSKTRSFFLVPIISVYSFIIFDDAPGALLAVAAIYTVEQQRFQDMPFVFLAASLVRFQSAAIATAYAFLKIIESRDPRYTLSFTSGIPVFGYYLSYSSISASGGAVHSIMPAINYLRYPLIPTIALMFLPVMYYDREAVKIMILSYVLNSFFSVVISSTPNVGWPRYYMVGAAYLATKVDEVKREYYKYYIPLAPIIYGLSKGILVGSIVIAVMVVSIYLLDTPEVLAISSRITTFFCAYDIWFYGLPHPPFYK